MDSSNAIFHVSRAAKVRSLQKSYVWLPILFIVPYFLFWTWRGLLQDFNYDDMMNLFKAWDAPRCSLVKDALLFWVNQTRPVGGLFYRTIYGISGFDPRPFRVACFILLIFNLVLAYRVLRYVSCPVAGWASLLIGCFHGPMWDIYASTGTVYDIICATFYSVALILYVQCRQVGRYPGTARSWAIAAFTLLAIDSKEMGVTIPAVLLIYELLFHVPEATVLAKTWIRKCAIGLIPSACVSALFAIGRLGFSGPLTGHAAYTPIWSYSQFLKTTTVYTRLLLCSAIHLDAFGAISFWICLLGIGMLLRSRPMVFGVLFFLLTLLPMSFVELRPGYVLYIPFTGVALYVGCFFERTYARLRGLVMLRLRVWVGGFLIALYIFGVGALHRSEERQIRGNRIAPGGQQEIRITADEISRLRPSLPSGSRVLLVNSPFGEEKYQGQFVLSLRYHVRDLAVESRRWDPVSSPLRVDDFDYTFVYDPALQRYEDVSLEVRSGLIQRFPESFVQMASPLAGLTIIRGIGGLQAGGWRWVLQDAEMRFTVPARAQLLVLSCRIHEFAFGKTGPMRVLFWMDDRPLGLWSIDSTEKQKLEIPLPNLPPEGSVVRVRMHVQNPFMEEHLHLPLGFLISDAGLK
jgi:hypothetical protein